jgi:hypothetical protein
MKKKNQREQRHEPVFKAVVLVNNQEECDIAKEICKKYDLPIWEDSHAFDWVDHGETYLFYKNTSHGGDDDYAFYIDIIDPEDLEERNVVSMQEFEQLAEQLNPQYDNIDDILIKMKELNRMLN